jgi:pilus assembly protein CpaF
VTEVLGFDLDAQKYLLQDVFVRKYHGVDAEGRVQSDLVPTGILPTCMHQLEEHGVTLPDPVLQAARNSSASRSHSKATA